MKKIILLILFINSIHFSQAQSSTSPIFSWASLTGSVNNTGADVVIDADGNTYTTGYFNGTVDFDASTNVFSLTSLNNSSDIFILKTDSSGKFLWVKTMGGPKYEIGVSITLDDEGNIYTTGTFYDVVDFDPGVAEYKLTATGKFSAFVSKLNPLGEFVWAKKIGGNSMENVTLISPSSINVDITGNTYVSGSFQENIDFDPGNAEYNLTATGIEVAFILKLDPSGNFSWVKSIASTTTINIIDALIDNAGNIFTVGRFYNKVDFDPGSGIIYKTSKGEDDMFFLKLTPSGDFAWVQTFGSIYSDALSSCTIDPSGNIYMSGHYSSTIEFNSLTDVIQLTAKPNDNPLILKIDATGNILWAKGVGGNVGGRSNDIAVDVLGNVYSLGVYTKTVDFDPSNGIFNLTSLNGYSDIYILKLNALGDFVWARSIGGDQPDYGNSIEIDALGNIFILCQFRGTVDVDPNSGVFTLTNTQYLNSFLEKLNQGSLEIPEVPTSIISNKSSLINISPNPTTGILNVHSSDAIDKIIIVDMLGKIVLETLVNPESTLDVSGLNNGIYYVSILSGGNSSAAKLIKQ